MNLLGDDNLYYKNLTLEKESGKKYSKKSQLYAMILARKKLASVWEQNILYGRFLAVAEANDVDSIAAIAEILARQEVAKAHPYLPAAAREPLVKDAKNRLLDQYYGISENERSALAFSQFSVQWPKSGVFFIAKDDEKTCDKCLALSGKRYSLKDAPEGHHKNCRCERIEFTELPGFATGIVTESDGGVATVKMSDGEHLVLDMAGLIPFVGTGADLLHAVIYITEGDYKNAAASVISTLPFVGLVSGTVKVVKGGIKIIKVSTKLTDPVTGMNKIAEIPVSRIMNYRYAGKAYPLGEDLAQKYPGGVKFSEAGFPNFSPHRHPDYPDVQVWNLTGDRPKDARLANEVLGLDKTPDGYQWHHVEDGVTMQLIPKDLHEEVKHTGGAAILKYITN